MDLNMILRRVYVSFSKQQNKNYRCAFRTPLTLFIHKDNNFIIKTIMASTKIIAGPVGTFV